MRFVLVRPDHSHKGFMQAVSLLFQRQAMDGGRDCVDLPGDGQLLWSGQCVLNGYGRFQGMLEGGTANLPGRG